MNTHASPPKFAIDCAGCPIRHRAVCSLCEADELTELEKIKKTLTIFMDKNYQSNFDELYILMLVNKQKSYSQQAVDKITGAQFSFDTKTHIIDCADILSKVTGLRVTAQKRILHEFKLILGDIDGYLALREPKANNSGVFTTNFAPVTFPKTVFVAQTTIVKKDVLSRAKSELDYKGVLGIFPSKVT